MTILISDLAKDCIDAMRKSKEAIDRMVLERYRLGALALAPTADAECGPALFRYSALDGGPQACVFCAAPTTPSADTLNALPTYPAHCVLLCDACRSCIDDQGLSSAP
jgi:hypothetical protein